MTSERTGFRPYPHYKPSGIEWLGDVPAHWEVRRLRSLANIATGGQDTINQQDDGKYPFFVRSQTVERIDTWSFDGEAVLTAGDGVGVGKVFHYVNGKFDYHQRVYKFSDFSAVSGKFFFHYFRALLRFEVLQGTAKSTVDSLRLPMLQNFPVALPPLSEQTAIVRYLDQADEHIRRYVSSRERLIELLEEYRQAVIHHAVTRGLDPDVRLKPSSVEWLGDVPAHWGVAAVKRHYSIQLGKMLQNGPNVPTDIAVPYLKAQHVQWFSVRTTDAPTMWASPHEIEQFGIRAGDLLVCEGGEGGRCSLVEEVPPGYIIQNALHRVRSSGNSRNDYLQYVMSSISKTGWFDAINNKATIAHFTAEKFGSLMIPVPPFPEQVAIVRYLDKATADIDAAIDRAHREIELLGEYRTRLIADVVTGKVDVREAAAELPQ